MIKITYTTREVPERHKFCDTCGVEIHIGLECSKAKCECCGKDLCAEHIGHEVDDGSDYRTVWCEICWNLGAKYRVEIEKLQVRIDELKAEWLKECK